VLNRNFWLLNPPESVRYRAAWRAGEVDTETVYCTKYPGHQRSGRRFDPLSVNVRGDSLPDFVWTWYSECLIQDSVQRVFREEGLRGYELKPVRMYLNDVSISTPTFWELVVTGWGGVASPESGVRLVSECPYCRHRVYSCFNDPKQLIDWSKWDGSDFFMIWPLPRFIFVSDKVAKLVSQRFSGAELQAFDEIRCGKTLTPGRLSYWMPEPRAREIGEPLDIF